MDFSLLSVINSFFSSHLPTDIDTGDTALHVAAQLNLDRMAAQLFELGASPSVQDNEGCTPVMVACSYGHLQTLEVLASRGIRFTGEH